MEQTKYIPTVEAIEKASGVLEEILTPTPFQRNNNLSDIYDAEVFLYILYHIILPITSAYQKK